MNRVHLAFKAFDCHELLCHAVAQQAGLYEKYDLVVTLLDSTFIPDASLPPGSYTVACGAALAEFLQGGRKRRVVFVACDRPMFWLYGGPGRKRLVELENARIATFPEAAPPAGFLRKLLADAAVSAQLLPCRDDIARLGLVRAGAVDAALLSSLFLPHQLEGAGLQRLAFIGDDLRLPSTGLGVDEGCLKHSPDRVARMVRVFREAMELIYTDDDLACSVLAETFRIPPEGLRTALPVIRRCYNRRGFSDEELLQNAIDGVAASMKTQSQPAAALYDFSLLKEDRLRD